MICKKSVRVASCLSCVLLDAGRESGKKKTGSEWLEWWGMRACCGGRKEGGSCRVVKLSTCCDWWWTNEWVVSWKEGRSFGVLKFGSVLWVNDSGLWILTLTLQKLQNILSPPLCTVFIKFVLYSQKPSMATPDHHNNTTTDQTHPHPHTERVSVFVHQKD